MYKRLLRLLNNSKGESLGETLIALVIASLGMIILAGAITSAARANKAGKDLEAAYEDTGEPDTVVGDPYTVTVGGKEFSVIVKTNTNERLYFYEEKKTDPTNP